MTNPAALLLEFFGRDRGGQVGVAFPPLFAATVALEEAMAALSLTGVNTRPYSQLPNLARSAIREFSDVNLEFIDGLNASGSFGKCTLQSAEMDLLELASEKLELAQFGTENTRGLIAALLESVQSAVIDDETLDPQLRLFISQAVLSVRAELDSYFVSGDFVLREAVLRLFGLLRAAETESKSPDKWTDVWREWGVPISQGLIVSLPQVAIGVAQVFNALESAAS